MMAGQANFPAAAKRRTVDRGDHRLAQGFQDAQLALERQHHVIEGFGLGLADLDEFIQVAAGEEGFLGRGDDHAGHVVFFRHQASDAGGHGLAIHRVHGVGRLARHVDGQDDDPVLALFVANGLRHEEASLKGSKAFDDGGNAHAAADTQGREAKAQASGFQFVEQGAEDRATGGAQRVAHGDGAAVDVDLVRIDGHVLDELQHH
ncbi:hypothetical protein D3C73_1105040 [compost metagenome]